MSKIIPGITLNRDGDIAICYIDFISKELKDLIIKNLSTICHGSHITDYFNEPLYSYEKTEIKLEKALAALTKKSKVELEISDKLRNLERTTIQSVIENKEAPQNTNIEGLLSEDNINKLNKLEKLALKISKAVGLVLNVIGIIIYCFIIFKLAELFSTSSIVENDYIKIKEPLVKYAPLVIIFLTFWKVPNFILGKPINAAKRIIYNYISPNE